MNLFDKFAIILLKIKQHYFLKNNVVLSLISIMVGFLLH